MALLGLGISCWIFWILLGLTLAEWIGIVLIISAILIWIPQNLRFYNHEVLAKNSSPRDVEDNCQLMNNDTLVLPTADTFTTWVM